MQTIERRKMMADGNVRIKLRIEGAEKAEKTVQSIENSFKSASRVIGNTMNDIGSSIANVGSQMTAGITLPIVGAVAASVNEFAKLEQSIGGIETLFKDSAQTVIRNANSAFQRAGVSANNYMEQATSFSATLLQGLGGDTAKAAEYADKAIVDMSDNANKMGTDIGMIQQAYQGFAKDNYTMLDNLKLGYGGTASEMARLVNESGVLNGEFEATAENVKDIPFSTLIDAIHVTQDELGITGTTAKEASETISGSFQSMVAAGQNLLGGLSQQGADVEKLMDNFVETVKIFADNVLGALETLWDNLPIPDWAKWLIGLVAIAGPILMIVGNIIIFLGNLITAIGIVGSAFAIVAGAITGPILAIIAGVLAIGGALVYLYNTNDEFKAKVEEIWLNIQLIFEEVVGIISDLVQGTFEILSDWWADNQQTFYDIVDRVWSAISDFFVTVMGAISDIINAVWQPISDWFQTNQGEILSTVDTVWITIGDIFMDVLSNIADDIERTFNIIVAVIEFAMPFIERMITLTMDIILQVISIAMAIIQGDWQKAWEEIKETAQVIWTGIKDMMIMLWDSVKDYFYDLWETVKETTISTWEGIVTWFQELPGKIMEVFNSIVESVANWISEMATKAQEFATEFGDKISQFFSELPYKIGFALGYVLTTVGLWVIEMGAKAIEVGTNFVNNVMTWFQQLPSRIQTWLTNTYNNVVAWVANMISKAIEAGSYFINSVVTWFQQLPSRVQTWLSSTIARAQTWVSSMGARATQAGSNFINNVINYFQQLPGRIQQWLSNAISRVVQWAGQLASRGRQAGQDLVSAVMNAVSSLPGKIATAGKNVVEGFWNGIQSMGSWISSKVSGFFTGIVDGAKAALGIHSPSRVFRDEVGKWIPLGAVEGIEGEQNKLDTAIEHLVKLPKVDNLIPKVKTPASYASGNDTVYEYNDNYDDSRVIELLEIIAQKSLDVYLSDKKVGEGVAPVIDKILGKYSKQNDERVAKPW